MSEERADNLVPTIYNDGPNDDYELEPGAGHVWIHVKNLSVLVSDDENLLTVRIGRRYWGDDKPDLAQVVVPYPSDED
jgi:hypothetical protein